MRGMPMRAVARLGFRLFPPDNFKASVEPCGVGLRLSMTWLASPSTSLMHLIRAFTSAYKAERIMWLRMMISHVG